LRILLLLALVPFSARALDIEHEEYAIIGWNDACACAVER